MNAATRTPGRPQARPSARPPARVSVSVPGVVLRAAGLSVRVQPRAVAVVAVLTALTLAVAAWAVASGTFTITATELWQVLGGQGPPAARYVVMELRLPRVLTAILVGAALGISGAVVQTLARNPLGSPDVIGFTAGSATGAFVAILAIGANALTVSVSAVVGGLGAAAAVYLLAYRRGVSGYRLVLVGIGVSALLFAVNDYLFTRADVSDAQTAAVWLSGSLNGRSWTHVLVGALALAVLAPVVLLLSRPLRMLEMGADSIRSLGVRLDRVQLVLLVVSVALAALATACAGPIAFVALAAPQLAARMVRSPGPHPVAAACTGSLLLVVSDAVAQRAPTGTQLPVGTVTAALGGVYLAWLLSREWRTR